ncbi:MAG: DUF2339 domain-containing protein [Bacteroidota bacterium]
MELQEKLTLKIDDIQRKLRECNYECNRLKEFVDDLLPDLLAPPAAEAPVPPRAEVPSAPPTAARKTPPAPVPPERVPPSPPPPVTPKPSPLPRVDAAPNSAARRAPQPKAPINVEEFIGGNVLNKIGIGILIIGIGIFVKYAIDQDWIGSIGRVLIGLLSGGILLTLAHRLRKKYASFSSVLLGGGLSVLYFTVAIAFHVYALFGQTTAFSLMVLITGAAVFFAIGYDRREVGVLALLGGFVTPFMVSTGEGNYVVLFSYILVLNLGFLVLSWFRDWKIVRILSYALTVLLVGGFLGRNLYLSDYADLGGMLTFSTIFFVVFFAMNIAFNVKANQALGALEYILVLSNSMFYFAAGLTILHYIDAEAYGGLFTAVLGAFHFAFIFPVRRLLKQDRNLAILLVGMVLTLITLAIPIQLRGNYITLFWAAEAVVLLVMARRTQLNLLQIASQVVSALAVIGIAWDWAVQYFGQMPTGRPPVLNGAFLTSLLTAGAMVALYFLYRRANSALRGAAGLSQVYRFLALPLLYIGGLLEIMDQGMAFGSFGLSLIGMATYTALFLSAMQVWASRDQQAGFGKVISALSALFFIGFGFFNLGEFTAMRTAYLLGFTSGSGFGWHVVPFLATLGLLGLTVRQQARTTDLRSDIGKLVVWGASLVFIVLLSLELDHLMVMAGFNLATAHKVGYPILWGATAFAMILVGMRRGLVSLRIGGLVLFCLILIKLFVYDIREVSTGGKIAAFISLGILLLVISFLYQRLRKLLFDD